MSQAPTNILKHIVLVSIFFLSFSLTASAACLKYWPEHALDGILRLDSIPPSEDGEPLSFPVLELDSAICMDADPEALENRALSDVQRVQVILRQDQSRRYQKLISQRVTVRGVVLGAISRRHVLPLVIDANSIVPISPSAEAFSKFWREFRSLALNAQCDRLITFAVLPLNSFGSLDTDRVDALDAAKLADFCPEMLRDQNEAMQSMGTSAPAAWRSSARVDDQARIGKFEFRYKEEEWRWISYYR